MRLLRLLLAALVGALSLVLLGSGTSYACSCAIAVAATETKGGDWALPLALVAGGGLTVLVAGLWLRYGRR